MRLAGLAGIGLAVVLGATVAEAQPLSRTPSGAPDFQGVWAAHFFTSLERPDGVSELVLPEDKAKELVAQLSQPLEGVYDPDFELFVPDKLMMIDGGYRTSWIVDPPDGRMPFTQAAKDALKRRGELSKGGFDNPEERPAAERCVSGMGHPPVHAISIVIPYQIVQTADAVLFVTEDTDMGRIIPIGDQAPPAIRTRSGYSRGRWDGDTLVVETTNFAAPDPAGASFRGQLVVGEGSRVVERLRRVSDDVLLYQFTIEDLALYEKPWLAEFVLTRQPGPLHEYACHEGNDSMVSILTAARLGRQK